MQEKIRHKRQTLQDMSRPLKQWLYTHKDHPYPTRTDKVTLALNSEMTWTAPLEALAGARTAAAVEAALGSTRPAPHPPWLRPGSKTGRA